MPLTTEEIATLTAALADNTLTAENPLLAPLAQMGLVLRTPTQETEFKDAYKTTVIQAHDRDGYAVVTEEYKKLSGKEPLANERATDFIKRVHSELTTELADAKTKAEKGGGGTDAEKAKISQMEQQIVKLKSDHATELQAINQKATQKLVDSSLNTAVAGFAGKFKKGLDESILGDIKESRLAKFKAKYEVTYDENGNEVVKDRATGEEVKDANYKLRSVSDLMAETFKDVMEAPIVQPGSGAPNPGNNGGTPPPAGDKPTKETYKLPETVKTRVQLDEDLMTRGLTVDDDAYHAIHEANAALPLGS